MLLFPPSSLFFWNFQWYQCFLLCSFHVYRTNTGWGCSSVGRVSDQRAADAGSIPWCSTGHFFQSTFGADSLMLFIHPRVWSHTLTSVYTLKNLYPCQSLVDYGNTIKTPSTHHRLGSMTLLQLAFPGDSYLNVPWEIPMGQYSWKAK